MGQDGERRFSIDPLSLCALRRVGFGKERKACASGPFGGWKHSLPATQTA